MREFLAAAFYFGLSAMQSHAATFSRADCAQYASKAGSTADELDLIMKALKAQSATVLTQSAPDNVRAAARHMDTVRDTLLMHAGEYVVSIREMKKQLEVCANDCLG